jgi:hypothetical protein
MSSQLLVGVEAQQSVQMFAEQNEVEAKSKQRAAGSKLEAVAADEPDEFEIRRRVFFAGTTAAS